MKVAKRRERRQSALVNKLCLLELSRPPLSLQVKEARRWGSYDKDARRQVFERQGKNYQPRTASIAVLNLSDSRKAFLARKIVAQSRYWISLDYGVRKLFCEMVIGPVGTKE